MPTTNQTIEAYDAEREMAFKRIDEKFGSARRRTKERIRWLKDHPSPRPASEQLRNIKRALWD